MRYQKINIRIWNDEKFCSLDTDSQRLFFYLLTSPHSNIIGFYVLKTGYAIEDLKVLTKDFHKDLKKLCDTGMVLYDEQSQVVLIKNYLSYNPITNPNQLKAAKEMLKCLPNTVLFQEFRLILEGLNEGLTKELLEGLKKDFGKATVTVTDTVTDTVSVKEDSLGKSENPFLEIIQDLNEKTEKAYKLTPATKTLIKARCSEGFTLDDFKKVHENMSAKWKYNPKMNQYLRPSTLYQASKFDGYLNAEISLSDRGLVSQRTEKNMHVMNNWLAKKKEEGEEKGAE